MNSQNLHYNYTQKASLNYESLWEKFHSLWARLIKATITSKLQIIEHFKTTHEPATENSWWSDQILLSSLKVQMRGQLASELRTERNSDQEKIICIYSYIDVPLESNLNLQNLSTLIVVDMIAQIKHVIISN